MAYFQHRFETVISLHPVGPYHYTVVYLDPVLHDVLPLREHPRLRIEADVGGLPVKGAWQPASGCWYLMLPKVPLRKAGMAVGQRVEVAFKVVPQDEVEVPAELQAQLRSKPCLAVAWAAYTPGQQRAFAHMVASAQLAPTQLARVDRVVQVLLGKAPLPWKHKAHSRKS